MSNLSAEAFPQFGFTTNVGVGATGWRVARTAAGETIIAGHFTQQSIVLGGMVLTNHTPTSAGYHDIFVIKYAANGETAWAVSAGGYSTDVCSDLSVDLNGNIFLVGKFYGTAFFGNTNISTSSFNGSGYIAKLDPNGNLLWVRVSGAIQVLSVAVDTAGNSYTTGSFRGPRAFGLVTVTNGSVFVAKYSATGDLIWVTADGDDGSTTYGIAVDSIGNSYLVGQFFGTSSIAQVTLTNRPGANQSSIFLAKCDSSGRFEWARQSLSWAHYEGSHEFNSGYAIREHQGDLYVGGVYMSAAFGFDNVRLTNRNSSVESEDIFIAKYTTSGTFLWATNAGGSDRDLLGNLTVDEGGEVALIGTVWAAGQIGTNNLGNGTGTDLFVAKLSSVGKVLWARQPSGSHLGRGNSLTGDQSGALFCIGDFSGTTTFDGTTLTNSDSVLSICLFELLGNPSLLSLRTPSHIVLQWPTNRPGFVLEENSGLESTNWAPSINPAGIVGAYFSSTNPLTGATRFFRLRK